MTTIVILLAVAVGVLGILVFGLLRTHAEILRALDRAGVPLDGASPTSGSRRTPVVDGAPSRGAADVVGTVPGGGPVKVALDGSHHTLIAFLSSGCRTCQTFWETFRDPALELPGHQTRLVIVGQDPAHDSESRLAELAPAHVRTVCSTDCWQTFDVPGSPYFVLVDGLTRRIVGSGTATTWDQVAGLLGRALADDALDHDRSSEPARRTVTETLADAGIGPDHPSLYPDPDAP